MGKDMTPLRRFEEWMFDNHATSFKRIVNKDIDIIIAIQEEKL